MIATPLNKIYLETNNLAEKVIEANKSSIDNTNTEIDLKQKTEKNKNERKENAVEYLASWIFKKYRQQYSELGSITAHKNSEHNYTTPM